MQTPPDASACSDNAPGQSAVKRSRNSRTPRSQHKPATKKALPTPIRNAINSRRKSYSKRATLKRAATPEAEAESESDVEDVPAAGGRKALPTPIRNAINSRRKSYSTRSVASVASDDEVSTAPEDNEAGATVDDAPATTSEVVTLKAPRVQAVRRSRRRVVVRRRRQLVDADESDDESRRSERETTAEV